MEQSYKINLPELPKLEEYNTDSFIDSQEISELNKSLINTIIKSRDISKKIDTYSRKKLQAEVIYKHKFREIMLQAEGKTESQKRLIAEIACEEEEIKVLYLDEMVKELTRMSYNLRQELDIMKTIGNNIRQELRM